jgi:cysteinyl-tRNA synthetase
LQPTVHDLALPIERLQEAGAAYATTAGIYFDLTAFPDDGRLSGRTSVLCGDPVSRLHANPTRSSLSALTHDATRPTPTT